MSAKSLVHGIGFIGRGVYTSKSPAYNVWKNMLERCFRPSRKNHVQNWSDVTVNPNWFDFQNFALWYEQQLIRYSSNDISFELDKDLLIPGNRKYGPDVCCVIPRQINSLFLDRSAQRGSLPLGVTRNGNRFIARVNQFGKNRNLGTYDTVREAQMMYWNAKFRVIQHTTIMYWNYLPEPLAMRFIQFGWSDAAAYYGNDAHLWSNDTGSV